MKSRLQRVEIRNFKAFRNFSLDLDGRHLLIYGPNGSGKSSLYWALYTFLQSGRKSTDEVAKYFDPYSSQNLLNLHEQSESSPLPGEISLVLRDCSSNADTPYRISLGEHGTGQKSEIVKGDLASDFITYRFFFGFSHFRNSDDFNIWPLFEREILPFCISPSFSAGEFEKQWIALKKEDPNPYRHRGKAGSNAFRDFNKRLDRYSNHLKTVVEKISEQAQIVYDQNFGFDDAVPVTLKLSLVRSAYYAKKSKVLIPPRIHFGIKKNGIDIPRPQSHLNEAKMTQLAISIRFAASNVNLHESDLKLLVLDDLLVSFDMSNRMKVVEILLSETFAPYQKVILTHELGFFQELRRHIGSKHSEWQFAKLAGNAKDNPSLSIAKSNLEVAEDYLANDQLTECGNRLRKCAETILENFLRVAREKKSHGQLIERGGFASLESKINEATASLSMSGYREFADLLQSNCTVDEFKAILSEEGIDHTKIAETDKRKKGKIVAKLMSIRNDMQDSVLALLTEESRKQLTAVRVLKEVKKIKDRILNPASHAGVTPVYTREAEDAIKIITQLQVALDNALTTL